MAKDWKTGKYVHGSRPVHTHVADDSERWPCNSPYCIDMQTNPPELDGPVPVIEGQEPWRGRQ